MSYRIRFLLFCFLLDFLDANLFPVRSQSTPLFHHFCALKFKKSLIWSEENLSNLHSRMQFEVSFPNVLPVFVCNLHVPASILLHGAQDNRICSEKLSSFNLIKDEILKIKKIKCCEKSYFLLRNGERGEISVVEMLVPWSLNLRFSNLFIGI